MVNSYESDLLYEHKSYKLQKIKYITGNYTFKFDELRARTCNNNSKEKEKEDDELLEKIATCICYPEIEKQKMQKSMSCSR